MRQTTLNVEIWSKTMSENTAVETTAAAPAKKTAAKKPIAKKPVAKKAVKKAAKTAKKEAGEPRKDFSDAQIRILKALKKAGKPLTGKLLAEKSETDASLIGKDAGYRDPEINSRPVHARNLLNRKFVKLEQHDVNGRDTFLYSITASGKAALEKHEKNA